MYSLPALLGGLRDGSIHFDLNGHNTPASGDPELLEEIRGQLLHQVVESIERELEHMEVLCRDSEASDSLREFYRQVHERNYSDQAVDIGRHYVSWGGSGAVWCAHCGADVRPYLKDAVTVSLCIPPLGRQDAPDTAPCIFAGGPRPHVTEIEVPSGDLVFVNFFRGIEDAPEEEEYTRPWSLNSLQGRQRRATYLAESQVGYGQMSNLSVDVLANPTMDRLHILDCDLSYIKEEIAYVHKKGMDLSREPRLRGMVRELEVLRNGEFTSQGGFSCAVWRWMCADRNIISALNLTPSDNDETVVVRVKPGRWRITHYYDLCLPETVIASTLEWVAPLKS